MGFDLVDHLIDRSNYAIQSFLINLPKRASALARRKPLNRIEWSTLSP